MKCGNCGTEFSEDEAVKVHGTNRYKNESKVIAHECPGCGDQLSKRFTREWNIDRCGHNATVDGTDGTEICSRCGAIFGPHRKRQGIKEEWAIPATPDMQV